MKAHIKIAWHFVCSPRVIEFTSHVNLAIGHTAETYTQNTQHNGIRLFRKWYCRLFPDTYNGKSSQNHLQTDRIGEIVLLTFRCGWPGLAIVCYGTHSLCLNLSAFILSLILHNLNTSVKWSTVFNGIFRIPSVLQQQSVVVGRMK